MEKTCTKCGETKPLSDFHKRPGRTDQWRPHCKLCRNAQNREYHLKYRESGHAKNSRLLYKYGITLDDYEQMRHNQGYVCAICGKDHNAERNYFEVDHDHATRKIRGLLCRECNTGLGKFQDDPDLLRKAADYLEETKLYYDEEIDDFYTRASRKGEAKG